VCFKVQKEIQIILKIELKKLERKRKENLFTTPSVPNYKSFQEYWRVKAFSSLTKNIERNIKIYVIK